MPRCFIFSLLSLTLLLAGCTCPAEQGATRIEADQKTGIVRIISDNRVVAYIDRNGSLHAADFVSTGGPVEEPAAGR
jgi:hypothetical protein